MTIPEEKLIRLLAYLNDNGNDRERRRIESEVAQDSRLKDDLECLRTIASALRAEDYPELREPARIMQRQLIQAARKRPRDRRTGVVTFDSKLLPLPAGVRPATVSARRLRFTNDRVVLELSVYPVTSASYQAIGQVSGAGSGARLSVAVQCGRSRLRCEANEFHVFQVDRVPAGVCKLTISQRDTVLMLVELEL